MEELKYHLVVFHPYRALQLYIQGIAQALLPAAPVFRVTSDCSEALIVDALIRSCDTSSLLFCSTTVLVVPSWLV